MLSMDIENILAQLNDLRGRVERLESGDKPASPNLKDPRKLVAEHLRTLGMDTPPHPVGHIALNTHYIIPRKGLERGETSTVFTDYALDDLLATTPDALARSLEGLAHPVRIAIFKALLDSPKEGAELVEVAGLNTTDQLYHHLRTMEQVGLVERRGQNLWALESIAASLFALGAAKMLAEWRGDE